MRVLSDTQDVRSLDFLHRDHFNTDLRDDTALHELPDWHVDAVELTLQGELERILRFFPLYTDKWSSAHQSDLIVYVSHRLTQANASTHLRQTMLQGMLWRSLGGDTAWSVL